MSLPRAVLITRQGILILIASTSNEGPGDSAHMRRLARVFAAHIYKVWIVYEKMKIQIQNPAGYVSSGEGGC